MTALLAPLKPSCTVVYTPVFRELAPGHGCAHYVLHQPAGLIVSLNLQELFRLFSENPGTQLARRVGDRQSYGSCLIPTFVPAPAQQLSAETSYSQAMQYGFGNVP